MNYLQLTLVAILVSLSLLLGLSNSLAQYADYAPQDYFYQIHTPDTLYKSGKYCEAAYEYSKVFKKNNDKGGLEDRYKAACAYAICGVNDSAFNQLNILITRAKFDQVNRLKRERKFEPLHNDSRWDTILIGTIRNAEFVPVQFPLVRKKLEKILKTDTQVRTEWQKIEKRHGRDSEPYQLHRKIIHATDSTNLSAIREILANYGWLGVNQIGQKANAAIFLVIQHSNPETQEEFLPMMQKAVKERKAFASDLALLEDRVLVGQGKDQLYGSQIGVDDTTNESCVFPISDPENVDTRRQRVGLGPISNYLMNWGIVWNPSKYPMCTSFN